MKTPKNEKDPTALALLWARSAAKTVKKFEGCPNPANDLNFQGFIDGMKRRVIPHPSPGVPPVRHSMAPEYVIGFELGEAFADAAEIFTNPEVAAKWLTMKSEE